MDKFIQKNGALHKDIFTFYFAQLILALEYLHSKGWVYGNMTLDNIYIRSNGYIRIEGLARNMKIKKK